MTVVRIGDKVIQYDQLRALCVVVLQLELTHEFLSAGDSHATFTAGSWNCLLQPLLTGMGTFGPSGSVNRPHPQVAQV